MAAAAAALSHLDGNRPLGLSGDQSSENFFSVAVELALRPCAIAVLARLSADGFTSLWCFYAAVASGAIALYLRFGQPEGSDSTDPMIMASG